MVMRLEFWEAVRPRNSSADGHTELGQDLHVLGPTHEHAVLFYQPLSPSPLPEFPVPDVPRLDRAPRLPRLPAQAPASSADLRAAATFPPYSVLSMAPSASLKPPALALPPGTPSAITSEHTLQPLRRGRQRPARRQRTRLLRVSSPPGDAEWHGTGVLLLKWDAPQGAVRAWKVTGGLNMPRGAQSWMFECARAVQAADVVDAVGEA